MKIVVSVNELSAETQTVIDNARRSKAPVMIGDADQPQAVLISFEEYRRLQAQMQAPAPPPASVVQPVAPMPAPPPRSEPVAEVTQPINLPIDSTAAVSKPAASAEVVPAEDHSDVARRTAAAVQADRAAMPEPKIVSQRPTVLQPDPALVARPAPGAAPQRAARLTKPMPKGLPRPPRPLNTPRPRGQVLASLRGNWQTIVLVLGVVVLGLVGFMLIVNAFGG